MASKFYSVVLFVSSFIIIFIMISFSSKRLYKSDVLVEVAPFVRNDYTILNGVEIAPYVYPLDVVIILANSFLDNNEKRYHYNGVFSLKERGNISGQIYLAYSEYDKSDTYAKLEKFLSDLINFNHNHNHKEFLKSNEFYKKSVKDYQKISSEQLKIKSDFESKFSNILECSVNLELSLLKEQEVKIFRRWYDPNPAKRFIISSIEKNQACLNDYIRIMKLNDDEISFISNYTRGYIKDLVDSSVIKENFSDFNNVSVLHNNKKSILVRPKMITILITAFLLTCVLWYVFKTLRIFKSLSIRIGMKSLNRN